MARSRSRSAKSSGPSGEFSRIERPLSLGAQVEQTLRRAIAEGAFPGGRLPTTVQLAEQLGVSRETIRLALDALQRDGLVVKQRRRGTFINPPAIPARLNLPATVIGYLQADYTDERGETEAVTSATGGTMFNGALTEAGRYGYQLLARSTRVIDLPQAFEQLTTQARLRGVIFASIAEEKFLRRLGGLNLPTVLLDHDLHLPKLSSVVPDAAGRAKLAVQHLAGLGHTRIAIAQWHQTDLNPWHLRGYREGMREAGLRCRRIWEIYARITPAGAEEAAERLLQTVPQPTAVICFNNTLAAELLTALQRRGKQVPGDVSLVGGGGADVLGLTCTQLDWFELGREAMRLLHRVITAGEQHQPEHRVLPYTLRPGQTTAPPGKNS